MDSYSKLQKCFMVDCEDNYRGNCSQVKKIIGIV